MLVNSMPRLPVRLLGNGDRVSSVHVNRFTGIADFQYISTTRVTGTPEGGAHAHDVDLPAASGPFGKEQENLEVVPPLFTKQDYEFEYGFRSDIASSKGTLADPSDC
jgi:hypothetical protein